MMHIKTQYKCMKKFYNAPSINEKMKHPISKPNVMISGHQLDTVRFHNMLSHVILTDTGNSSKFRSSSIIRAIQYISYRLSRPYMSLIRQISLIGQIVTING